MITGKDIYATLEAIVPLYVAMFLAYGSVKWWKIFTPDQCFGINRFVAVFAVPLLSFHFISSNNPYAMNYRFLAADSLQKVVILGALLAWQTLSKRGSLDWMITLFSLSTLPNTLVMGIPLLKAMYGDFSGNLMVQIVVLQSVIWYTLMLFLFEYRGAKLLISDQFPETAGSISSFRVDNDIISLNGREPLQTDAEIGDDGKLHVRVRRSNDPSMVSSFKSHGVTSMTPRASNLTGVEIYSVQSSREPTPRGSSFTQADVYSMLASKVTSPKEGGDVFSLQSSKAATPRTSNFDEEITKLSKIKGGRSINNGKAVDGELTSHHPPGETSSSCVASTAGGKSNGGCSGSNMGLHMFVWSSSASPTSETLAANKAATSDFTDRFKTGNGHFGNGGGDDDMEQGAPTYESSQKGQELEGDNEKQRQMPPASVMSRLILIMVWRKLIRNPNTYSSLLGVVWSLISFRWNIHMPAIIKDSISILSDAGLGMAMFSLGLFMAVQPKIIACGKSKAAFAMAVRFLTGPAVIATTSIAIGLRRVLLQVAIVQAALPQGIVPFVFAKEYNVHPDILSTGVIFGMLIALPITILYYFLLGL